MIATHKTFRDFISHFPLCIKTLQHDATIIAKEILLHVAETLPVNATLVDAINQLEMFVAREDRAEITSSMRHAITAEKPEWLYNSPSRVSAVLRQSQRSVSTPARSFCE
jgi:hypothetical protein